MLINSSSVITVCSKQGTSESEATHALYGHETMTEMLSYPPVKILECLLRVLCCLNMNLPLLNFEINHQTKCNIAKPAFILICERRHVVWSVIQDECNLTN